MTKQPKILFVGGGTGGHIFPLINLEKKFRENKILTKIILADQPLDQRIAKDNFPFNYTDFIKPAKFHYYWTWKNLLTPFQLLRSFFQSGKILFREKPNALFLKGGFVCFPFLILAKLYNFFVQKGKQIKFFAHESDASPGAITKLTNKFGGKIFANFGNTPLPLFFLPKDSIKTHEKKTSIPNLLIVGGSQGAEFLNNLFIQNQKELCEKFFVTLITGNKKQIDFKNKNFVQYAFLPAEKLREKIIESDYIISRAGANALLEIIKAQKKSLIIPLPSAARNHQLFNAQYFAKKNLIKVFPQNTQSDLLHALENLQNDEMLAKNLKTYDLHSSEDQIFKIIKKEI